MGDTDAMAANAIKILQNNDTLHTFKENALKSAQKFDIQNILPLYEEVYQKAIQLLS